MAENRDQFAIPDRICGGSPRRNNEPQIFEKVLPPNDLQDGGHMVPVIPDIILPGPFEDAANDDAANDQNIGLLEEDRRVVHAVGTVLPEIPIINDHITCIHYIPILRNMGYINLEDVPHGQEYALILRRLANSLEVVHSENPFCTDHFFDPLDYHECLNTLVADMDRSDVIMGIPQDLVVYVLKDKGPYVQCLEWVAAQLQEE